jgi:hypothetical protein
LTELSQALAEGSGAHTKMGTWAVDEREAELCELIADQDERWDEAIVGKEQWINKPAQPPGLLRTGQSTLYSFVGLTSHHWQQRAASLASAICSLLHLLCFVSSSCPFVCRVLAALPASVLASSQAAAKLGLGGQPTC